MPETSGLKGAAIGNGVGIARRKGKEGEEELHLLELEETLREGRLGKAATGQVCFQDWELRQEHRHRELQEQLHPCSQVPLEDLDGGALQDQESMGVQGKGRREGQKGKKEGK